MTARTGLLLTIALVILILLGARQLSVADDVQISSAGSRESDSQPLGSPEISATSSRIAPGDEVYDAVDLYGNEVTAAVATYKLDGAGALYELHSPQTELPQLAPPKS